MYTTRQAKNARSAALNAFFDVAEAFSAAHLRRNAHDLALILAKVLPPGMKMPEHLNT